MQWKNMFLACFGLLHIGTVWAAGFWFFSHLKTKAKVGAELLKERQRLKRLRRLTLTLLLLVVLIYVLLFSFFPNVLGLQRG
jgi:hypothetical protein